jgi:phage tail sheath protein FI
MPGVVVNTAVRSAPTATNIAPASTFFVAGTSKRGPLDVARMVRSLEAFKSIYGGYDVNFTLYQQLQTFFEEGGAQAYVVRVSNAQDVGVLDLLDDEDVAALTLTAANAGAWSDNLTVSSTDSLTSVGKFTVRLYDDGILVYSTDLVTAASQVTEKINTSQVAKLYVTASTSNASATLAEVSEVPLDGGEEADPIEDALVDADYIDALELFDIAYGAGAVSIPGQFSATVYEAILEHGSVNNRIALLGLDPSFTTVLQAENAIAAVRELPDSANAAFYYPYVTIPAAGGVTLTIPPEGYVAAKRSKAHNEYGAWQAAAGIISVGNFVTGISVATPKPFGDSLDEAGINAIRIIQNTVRIYGARSASTDADNFRYITARDTLNYIASEANRSLEDLVFSTIDGRRSVFGRVEARLINILEPIRSAGGLYEGFADDGRQIDAGYSVEVSDALNPITQLAEGIVKAKVGVRVSSVGDRIEIDVIKSNLTSSVV